MRPVHLQFDGGRPSPLKWLIGARGGAVGWCGLAFATACLGGAVILTRQLTHTQEELDAAQSELQALGRSRPVAPTNATTLTAEQRRAWTQVVNQLNTPWAALLAGLESGTPENVALVAIEPDSRQASVRLQAEAKTLDALLAYAQALQGVDPFAEVALLKHETNDQDPNRPLRLTLSLRLRETKAGDAAPPGDAQ